MRINRVVPNLTVADLPRAVAEYQEVLGLAVLMDHGWIVALGDDAGHQLSLMTADASASLNPDVSVFVDDVHEALSRVEAAGLDVVHPLTEEVLQRRGGEFTAHRRPASGPRSSRTHASPRPLRRKARPLAPG